MGPMSNDRRRRTRLVQRAALFGLAALAVRVFAGCAGDSELAAEPTSPGVNRRAGSNRDSDSRADRPCRHGSSL